MPLQIPPPQPPLPHVFSRRNSRFRHVSLLRGVAQIVRLSADKCLSLRTKCGTSCGAFGLVALQADQIPGTREPVFTALGWGVVIVVAAVFFAAFYLLRRR